ncbi:hypothetical protein BSKO_12157 [Bryopsis sp. KO-2023]|nr:hypothetical protein BSKO_12157 [Bryopsis sp. KO-2023]
MEGGEETVTEIPPQAEEVSAVPADVIDPSPVDEAVAEAVADASPEIEMPFNLDIPTPVAVALVVVILTILVGTWLSRRSKSRANSVLIMGPVNAGKTTLFLELKEGGHRNGTVTSMEQNEDTFVPNREGIKKPVHFVDLPGHPRLINKFENYMGGTVGVIFVLDAADFLDNGRAIAEQLWTVISHPQFSSRRVPLLIACNKYDLGTRAHTDGFIEKRLQREIDEVRSTHSSLEGDAGAPSVGKGNEGFLFQQLKSKVAIAKISAKLGGKEVEPVYDFITNCVK